MLYVTKQSQMQASKLFVAILTHNILRKALKDDHRLCGYDLVSSDCMRAAEQDICRHYSLHLVTYTVCIFYHL